MQLDDIAGLKNLGQQHGVAVKLGFFSRSGDKKAELQVEVADTPDKRKLGLAKRAEIQQDSGMFFDKAASFWMRDVGFPLDIMFLDKKGEILDIQHMPVESGPDYTVYRPSSGYCCNAVEAPGRWAKMNLIEIGDKVKLC
jgi:uncharacterized protein